MPTTNEPKDFVRAVAAAYGAGDPNLTEIGQRALAELERERNRLRTQAEMIRQLLNLAPRPEAEVVVQTSNESATVTEQAQVAIVSGTTNGAPNGTLAGRLSDAVKDAIRELWRAEAGRGRYMTAAEVLEHLDSNGFHIGVSQPLPSVATVVFATRRQFEKEQGVRPEDQR